MSEMSIGENIKSFLKNIGGLATKRVTAKVAEKISGLTK